jgi:ribosomal protein S18 acetylase RimI-like enzyme
MNPDTITWQPVGTSLQTAVTCRRARRADIIKLVEIENICFDYYRLSARNFYHLMHKGSCDFIVAESHDKVCGYAIVLYRKNRESARLYSLAVLPEFRQNGIGRLFMEISTELAQRKGNQYLYLEVKSASKGLINFYEGQGFKKYKITEDYYGENEHALQLRKELSGR